MVVVNQLRPHTGFAIFGLWEVAQEITSTNIALDEEYWLALRHPAETQTAGYALLTSNRSDFAALPDSEKAAMWKEFRAYIRQGEGFYRGATVLPWKSSPLNYYYSFLNLAKAAALACGLLKPQLPVEQRVIHHGISAKVVAGNPAGAPDQWSMRVRDPTDVFGLLYALSIGTFIAEDTELEGHRLLRYVSPIQWQMGKSGYGPCPWCPCFWVLMVNQPTNESWDLLIFPRQFLVDDMPEAFKAVYQEVASNAAQPFAWTALKLHAVQANRLRFLQRAAPVDNPKKIEESIRSTAPYSLHESLATVEQQVALSLPYNTGGNNVPMTELIAAYGVMYFLSHLVRYNPDYMDRIGESSDAWLIESFAKSVPLFLLRYLTREILGYPLKIISM